MELTYHRNGNYLFPNLILENEAEEPVGKYGLLRKQYLKEHKTNWYGCLADVDHPFIPWSGPAIRQSSCGKCGTARAGRRDGTSGIHAP